MSIESGGLSAGLTKGCLACAVLGLWAALPLVGMAADPPSNAFAAAVADPSRPATDTERDANRKPAETLALDRKSTRLNSSHESTSRMPSSA